MTRLILLSTYSASKILCILCPLIYLCMYAKLQLTYFRVYVYVYTGIVTVRAQPSSSESCTVTAYGYTHYGIHVLCIILTVCILYMLYIYIVYTIHIMYTYIVHLLCTITLVSLVLLLCIYIRVDIRVRRSPSKRNRHCGLRSADFRVPASPLDMTDE